MTFKNKVNNKKLYKERSKKTGKFTGFIGDLLEKELKGDTK